MPETNQSDIPHQAQESVHLLLVQQRFGTTAQAYTSSTVHSQGPDLDWMVEVAALSGKERIVDVATGTGFAAFALAPYAHEVVGINVTLPMLEAAHRLATERQVTNVRFLQGDALAGGGIAALLGEGIPAPMQERRPLPGSGRQGPGWGIAIHTLGPGTRQRRRPWLRDTMAWPMSDMLQQGNQTLQRRSLLGAFPRTMAQTKYLDRSLGH